MTTWPRRYDRYGEPIEPDEDEPQPRRGWPFVEPEPVDDEQEDE